MKKTNTHIPCARLMLAGLLCFSLLVPFSGFAQEDVENSKDHPLFSRMSNFYIDNFKQNFDLVEFTYMVDEEEKEMAVEGDVTEIAYYLKDDKPAPSPYQIIKNHVQAAEGLGAEIIEKRRDHAVMKVTIDGRQAWVIVEVFNGGEAYNLRVIQLGEMEQEVTAGGLMDELTKKGRAVVYIHFATNSADPDEKAQPVISEIVALLLQHPELKLTIEGHTDSSGDAEDNLRLSRERAAAVVDALKEAGISAERLRSQGYGDTRPIADNETPEGRAKNRRVELVKS